MNYTNFAYGVSGVIIFFVFGLSNTWKSFLVGWIISVVNLEILKKIGFILIQVFNNLKPGPSLWFFLIMKFIFLGGALYWLSETKWLVAVPFLLGTTTVLIAGLSLGIKEVYYARS